VCKRGYAPPQESELKGIGLSCCVLISKCIGCGVGVGDARMLCWLQPCLLYGQQLRQFFFERVKMLYVRTRIGDILQRAYSTTLFVQRKVPVFSLFIAGPSFSRRRWLPSRQKPLAPRRRAVQLQIKGSYRYVDGIWFLFLSCLSDLTQIARRKGSREKNKKTLVHLRAPSDSLHIAARKTHHILMAVLMLPSAESRHKQPRWSRCLPTESRLPSPPRNARLTFLWRRED